ncbi:hypothetical protein FBU30_002445 [Linnemannia zychae]|nr:hypothetical protein FBU30_002445 [Linnemannia zychae]
MAFIPIIVALVFAGIFIATTIFICYKRSVVESQYRRHMRYQQRESDAYHQQLYNIPDIHEDSVTILPQSHTRQKQHDVNFPYTHSSKSNRSVNQLGSLNVNQEDHRRADDLLNSSLEQRTELQQPPSSPQQQRNRPASPSQPPSETYLSSPFSEPSSPPTAYLRQASSRKPDRTNVSTSPPFSAMRLQEPAQLSSNMLGNGNATENDHMRRESNNYVVKPSPLPRPLDRCRPIVADTSIAPSSKVIGTIGRGTPLATQDEDIDSPIEPPVVIVNKSPELVAMELKILSQSQSSASPVLHKAPLPAKSSARRDSIRRQAATTQTQSPGHAQVQTQTQTQTQTQLTPHKPIHLPDSIIEEQESIQDPDNPFMSKEEYYPSGPHAILPPDFKHAQFTLPLSPLPLKDAKVKDDSSDGNTTELDTVRLVLEPYLQAVESAARTPVPTPAITSPADRITTQNTIAANVKDQQPNLSQSKFKAQQQVILFPQNIQPPAPMPDSSLMTQNPIHLYSTPSPSRSNFTAHPQATPYTQSNIPPSPNTRIKPKPQALPPSQGSRTESSSQTGSERATSPALSTTYTSSSISASFSTISSVSDATSFISLGDTPTTTAPLPRAPNGLPSMNSSSYISKEMSDSASALTPLQKEQLSLSSSIDGDGGIGWEPPVSYFTRGIDIGVAQQQAKKTRVPEAVGGGTRLSHFNFES